MQANQARLLATAEVGRLLASADDLKRLASLREDVLAKQQVGWLADGRGAAEGRLHAMGFHRLAF